MPILQSFRHDIWIADGGAVSVAGFRYPTRMAVIRLNADGLADGGLFVWSPVALTEALQAEVDALGYVRFIVAPNSLHHLYVSAWQTAYPDARTFGAPGLAKRQPHIVLAGELGNAPQAGWAGDIDQVVVGGNAITTEVVFFHRASGTVVFTDLIQNYPKGWFRGWRGIVARLDRMTAAEPEVPRKFRLAFTDREAARAAIRRILQWPARQVLMAHGPQVETDAAGFLQRAFRWLKA